LLLGALNFAQIEYRAHYRQVGTALLNGRNLKRQVTKVRSNKRINPKSNFC